MKKGWFLNHPKTIVYNIDCIAAWLFLNRANFLFQSTAKYYELFCIKTPTIFDHITNFNDLDAFSMTNKSLILSC